MSEDTSSNRGKGSPFSNPTVVAALITGIITLVVALITALPQLVPLLSKPTETPIPTLTATVPPTSLPTATEVRATDTATEVPPTATETITPSPTPVDPGIACLDRWQVIASDGSKPEPTAGDGCDNVGIPTLGISTTGQQLIFGVNNFQSQGIFGVSTSLPTNANISLKVKMNSLQVGEFWIALSNEPTPDGNMLIFALQPEFGELRTYVDQSNNYASRYLWSNLTTNTNYGGGPPYVYDMTLNTSGGQVTYRLNFLEPQTQSVNLPKYLFFGFRNKVGQGQGMVSMNIVVSGLEIKAGQ